MGMDVYGVNPKTNDSSVKPKDINFGESTEKEQDVYFESVDKYEKENPGVYFRANVWSWRPIHELMAYFCEKFDARYGRELIDHKTLIGMGSNNGLGPDTKTCAILANMFESWMEHNANGHSIDLGCRVEKEASGEFGGHKFTKDDNPKTTMSAHSVDNEHLKVFVEFLRNCGGFEVW